MKLFEIIKNVKNQYEYWIASTKMPSLDGSGIGDDAANMILKIATDFASADVVVVNENDEEVKVTPAMKLPLHQFKDPNWSVNYKQQMLQYVVHLLSCGEMFLYAKDGGETWIINPKLSNFSFKSKNQMSVENYSELIDTINYNMHGGAVKLKNDGIHAIFDVEMSPLTLRGVPRNELIPDTVELSIKSRKALSGAMDRIALMLLTPDNGDNKAISHGLQMFDKKGDDKVEVEREAFKDQLSLEKHSVTTLDKPYKVLDTNPDNGKLKALESIAQCQQDIANVYDFPYKLYGPEATYNNLEIHISRYINTLQTLGSKYMATYNKILVPEDSKYKLALSFETLKETLQTQADEGEVTT